MEFDVVDVGDFLRILKKRSLLILGVVGICSAGFLAAAYILPKKYKSSTVLTIYTRYFHLPLVKDFTQDTTDGRELRIQRESLIRQALSDSFLDELGQKYKIFRHPIDHIYHHGERQEFLKQIEILSLNEATYEISYITKDPEVAYQIVSNVLQQVIQTLVTERRNKITSLRDAIRKNIETIGLMVKQSADPRAADRPELLLQEKRRLDSQIEALTKNYTVKHPAVARLIARANVLERWLKSAQSHSEIGSPDNSGMDTAAIMKPLVGGEPTEAEMEVYADLIQKLNYLNIAYDVEGSDKPSYVGMIEPPFRPYKALWPKKSLFLMWGIMTGLLISAFLLFCLEYLKKGRKKAAQPIIADASSVLDLTSVSQRKDSVWN